MSSAKIEKAANNFFRAKMESSQTTRFPLHFRSGWSTYNVDDRERRPQNDYITATHNVNKKGSTPKVVDKYLL